MTAAHQKTRSTIRLGAGIPIAFGLPKASAVAPAAFGIRPRPSHGNTRQEERGWPDRPERPSMTAATNEKARHLGYSGAGNGAESCGCNSSAPVPFCYHGLYMETLPIWLGKKKPLGGGIGGGNKRYNVESDSRSMRKFDGAEANL